MIFCGGGGSKGFQWGGGISHSQQCIKEERDYKKLTANELLLRGDHKNIKPTSFPPPPSPPRAHPWPVSKSQSKI